MFTEKVVSLMEARKTAAEKYQEELDKLIEARKQLEEETAQLFEKKKYPEAIKAKKKLADIDNDIETFEEAIELAKNEKLPAQVIMSEYRGCIKPFEEQTEEARKLADKAFTEFQKALYAIEEADRQASEVRGEWSRLMQSETPSEQSGIPWGFGHTPANAKAIYKNYAGKL